MKYFTFALVKDRDRCIFKFVNNIGGSMNTAIRKNIAVKPKVHELVRKEAFASRRGIADVASEALKIGVKTIKANRIGK